jgi:hypothetical protein
MHIIDPGFGAHRDPVPNFKPEAERMSDVDPFFWRLVK